MKYSSDFTFPPGEVSAKRSCNCRPNLGSVQQVPNASGSKLAQCLYIWPAPRESNPDPEISGPTPKPLNYSLHDECHAVESFIGIASKAVVGDLKSISLQGQQSMNKRVVPQYWSKLHTLLHIKNTEWSNIFCPSPHSNWLANNTRPLVLVNTWLLTTEQASPQDQWE